LKAGVGVTAAEELTPISNPVTKAARANADSIPFFIRNPSCLD
jgi:hypothetical protein